MAEPTGTHPTPGGEAFPTTSLPGTAHPNPPATDQQGIKGVDPKSQTGTPAASKPPKK